MGYGHGRPWTTTTFTTSAASSASTATPRPPTSTYLGLHALQHRGQESAGIVTSDGEQLYAHRAMGLVQDAFTQEQLAQLPGRIAIGHVRYSTAGGSHLKNAQPIAVDYARGSLAVCHNGNLTNAEELRDRARGARLDLPERHATPR